MTAVDGGDDLVEWSGVEWSDGDGDGGGDGDGDGDGRCRAGRAS